jgi:hypothetical protein
MTQVTDEQIQPAETNKQRYIRFSSETYFDYKIAREEAEHIFRRLTNLVPLLEGMTSETHKVRVKRRVKNGKESFDVISYESIDHKKKMDKASAEAAQEREGTKIISKKKA